MRKSLLALIGVASTVGFILMVKLYDVLLSLAFGITENILSGFLGFTLAIVTVLFSCYLIEDFGKPKETKWEDE